MSNLIPCLKTAWTTTKHKYFVFVAGLRLNVPIYQLLIHDLSKYTPDELPHYARQFFGDASQPDAFNRAWLHHQNTNPHHWEYWIPRTSHDLGCVAPLQPMQMPDNYVREMVADWLGASRGYEGKWPTNTQSWPWFQKAFNNVNVHPQTRLDIFRYLRLAGVTTS